MLRKRSSVPVFQARLSRSSFLARESEAGIGTFPFLIQYKTGGCQGFKGPAPSTLLDELSETTFHCAYNITFPAHVPPFLVFFSGTASK